CFPGRGGVFYGLEALQNPHRNVGINVSLYKKSNGYRPHLFNQTLDFCYYMRNPRAHPLIYMMHKVFLSNSNMNHSCPYNFSAILNLILIVELFPNIRGAHFRFTNIDCCTLDSGFVEVKECNLKMVRRNVVGMNFHIALKYGKPIDKIQFNLSIFRKSNLNLGAFKTANNRRIQFLNETLDFCVLGQQLLANKFFKFLMTPLMRFSNVNGTCPIQQDIIVNGFSVDENTIKEIPIPNGDYMFQLRTSLLKKWRTVVRVYATRVDKYSE
ncbi:hypothetical protein M5D96_006373, partial [Drosophila gunungcola]